jgi:hypothetical protein
MGQSTLYQDWSNMFGLNAGGNALGATTFLSFKIQSKNWWINPKAEW